MLSLIELSKILCGVMTAIELRQFSAIISAFFCVSHTTTTKSLGRYATCSERSLFRFLGGEYKWAEIRCKLFAACSWDKTGDYILAIDETVEGKSRSKTFGKGYFYSSTAQRAIPSVCFFGITLVHVKSATAYFLGVEQVVQTHEDKTRIAEAKAERVAKKAKKGAETAKKGRQPGSKNKTKEENPTASFRTYKTLLKNTLAAIRKCLSGINLYYIVADSAYGTPDYAAFAAQHGLHLISKFKANAALYLPYQGAQKGKRTKMYGQKLDPANLPVSMLKEEITNDEYKVQYFQTKAYAKNTFGPQLLHIVVLRITYLSNKKVSTQIWFSNDLTIDYLTILHYYHLRFQIEFDFRDAKQHFGFADFKNYKQRNLTNFVNLSFTMCLITKIYQARLRQTLAIPKLSVLDIKSIFKARYIAHSLLKLIQKDQYLIFNAKICDEFIPNDLINAA